MSSPSPLFLTPGSFKRGYRFGPFELELRSGEIRKHGVRVRVRKQSSQILAVLLEHAGEVVLREEIRRTLWPDNTVVEFDHSINTAIQRLRDVLGDSPEGSRYIETLPGRGYRFIGTAEILNREPSRLTLAPPSAGSPVPAKDEGVPEVETPSNRWRAPLAAVLTGLCALALLGWWRTTASRSPSRNWVFSLGPVGAAVPAPDGSVVLFRRAGRLVFHRLDSTAETDVYTASRLADDPVWSPDGSQALFHTMQGVVRCPVPHGPPVVISPDTGITRGYSWGPDGRVLVALIGPDGAGSLDLVSLGGGPPARLEIPQFKGGLFYEPEFLPERGKFLFTWAADGDTDAGIYMATLHNGRVVDRPTLLRRNITAGHFAGGRDNRLLYVQGNNLYAQALSVRNGVLEGEPRRIVENVVTAFERRHAFFSASRSGALAWMSGKADLAQLTWFDRRGNVLGTAGPPCESSAVFLSPHEDRLLLTLGDHFSGVLEPLQPSYVRLAALCKGIWTPDGNHILHHPRESDLVLQRDVARGEDREVARIPGIRALRAISPDGKTLLYDGDRLLSAIRLSGAGEQAGPWVVLRDRNTHAGFSPDGRWIVYQAEVPSVNRTEVFVRQLALSGMGKQISMDGGNRPVWRGDGKEILYLNGNKIYSVPVSVLRDGIKVGAPESLFEVRVPMGLVGDSVPLAVTRDGSRILFTQAIETTGSRMTFMMTAWDQ